MLQEWLQHHPAPSWKLVAWALYRSGGLTEHNMLKQLYGKYVTGMRLCTVLICFVYVVTTIKISLFNACLWLGRGERVVVGGKKVLNRPTVQQLHFIHLILSLSSLHVEWITSSTANNIGGIDFYKWRIT